jgi:hypothetical protein
MVVVWEDQLHPARAATKVGFRVVAMLAPAKAGAVVV